MAQLIIAAAGAAIGGALVPGVIGLGVTGAQAGWIVGSLIGSSFAPTQKSQGPRLNDLSVGSSAYGTPIPYVQGAPRIAGQIVWASTKREVATTTRQGGKGGGKQKVTTYSYEVDLLILLTDNVITGVSRIWSNGKLVWNKSAAADAGTLAASDATAAWTRITSYTGAASQLPDPTYEAAVGTANAPAYRGRGSVFIQGLQLGGSGQIPNLTFEIDGAVSGDHPVGDGLTRLQTTFAYGSSIDLSAYAIGSGTNTGGTVQAGRYEITQDGATYRGLSWTNAGLGRVAGTGHTMEFFVRATEITVNPTAGVTFAHCDMANMDQTLFFVNGLISSKNTLAAYALPSWFSNTADSVDVYTGAYHHVAIVWDAAGQYSLYFRGIRVVTLAGTGDKGYASGVGSVTLGAIGAAGQSTKFEFGGVRVRRAAMYSGASFTPPTSPAAWGSP